MILVTSVSFTDDSNICPLFSATASAIMPGNFHNHLNVPSNALASHFVDLISIDQVLHLSYLLSYMLQPKALSLESHFQ